MSLSSLSSGNGSKSSYLERNFAKRHFKLDYSKCHELKRTELLEFARRKMRTLKHNFTAREILGMSNEELCIYLTTSASTFSEIRNIFLKNFTKKYFLNSLKSQGLLGLVRI